MKKKSLDARKYMHNKDSDFELAKSSNVKFSAEKYLFFV